MDDTVAAALESLLASNNRLTDLDISHNRLTALGGKVGGGARARVYVHLCVCVRVHTQMSASVCVCVCFRRFRVSQKWCVWCLKYFLCVYAWGGGHGGFLVTCHGAQGIAKGLRTNTTLKVLKTGFHSFGAQCARRTNIRAGI